MEESLRMQEPPTRFPAGWPPDVPAAREASRRSLLRRLLALLAAGSTAFALTTWTLVRYEDPLGLMESGSAPTNLVKAQLEALNRGQIRAAYEMFSPHYRQQVSFEAFEHLVATHRRMFRTREIRVSSRQEFGERAVLEMHLVGETGKRYRARFTLVRAADRWWIDDLRWGLETDTKGRLSI